MVAVISNTGARLMPTSNYRARKLLAKGKAVAIGFRPFTIKLLQRASGDTQPIECSIDTGYNHVGNSLKSAKHEFAAVEVRTLSDEAKKHCKRSLHRRMRRHRLRYRKPRFNNQLLTKGWLPPSIRHRKDCNLDFFKKTAKVVPITSVTLEMAKFDTLLLKMLEEGKEPPKGTDYQRGERYGTSTPREAILARDGYTCQYCGKSIKDGAKLKHHHIEYRSKGGSNSISNFITVCDKCHTQENHMPGGKLYSQKPKVKSLSEAAFMMTIRWELYNEIKVNFPDVELQINYGAKTASKRRELNIQKSHVNDAFAIGDFHPKHRARPVILQKKRRNNRILERFYDAKYIDLRTGDEIKGKLLTNGRTNRNHNSDTENLHKYRKRKLTKGKRTIRRKRYPIQPHDIIIYYGHAFEAIGCNKYGKNVQFFIDKTNREKKNAVLSKIKLKHYSGGYYPVTS